MRKIVFMLLAGVMCLTGLPVRAAGFEAFQAVNEYVPGQFADVAQDSWYAPYVAASFECGLAQGDDKGLFLPEDDIMTAAVITMAARMHAAYRGVSYDVFDQTVGTHWYDTYVHYAKESKLLTGLDGLDYTAPAKRWQVARLMINALPSEAFVTINIVDNGAIPDVSMEKPYAAGVYTLYRAGVLTGTPPINAFQPESPVSRGEVAAFFARAVLPELRRPLELRGARDTYVQDVLRLVNQSRAAQALDPLMPDADILLAASVRASEIQTLFSHTRPDGFNCLSALVENGVSYRIAAENIASGQPSPEDAVSFWLADDTYRANILNPAYGRLGVGYYLAGNGTTYWVLIFCN